MIKCPNHGCKSEEFILISIDKSPRIVDNKGNFISTVYHEYKCTICLTSFKSPIGPNSPKKLLLD